MKCVHMQCYQCEDEETTALRQELEAARALLADSPTAAARQVVAAVREREEAREEAEAWRWVARYYLGKDFVDSHGPKECREEAVRRALERGEKEAAVFANTLRAVAEEQREACAAVLDGPDAVSAAEVRATPLVTDNAHEPS